MAAHSLPALGPRLGDAHRAQGRPGKRCSPEPRQAGGAFRGCRGEIGGRWAVIVAPSSLRKRSRNERCQASEADLTSLSETPRRELDGTTLRVTISTEDAQQALQWDLLQERTGQIVVVSAVAPGSQAQQVGIAVGYRLCSISDPVRPDEMWPLNDRASVRFVRDSIKFRRPGTINLEFELPAGAVSEADTTTVGDRLAQKYERDEDKRKALSDVQKRIRRRKDYMEEVGQRDDSAFFTGAIASVVVPPLLILLVAYFTGYLDVLYMGVTRR
ncbi:unnamed protein product [Ostreobium quekettii]|uniref:Uncharacterized protein n=1 Tax=Ostreobium quekettii TaxID=121088 RepID=A0A8S1IQT0_9CHLO|nr:unnamed protein product [Ostreobium quekettii]|eukprot:evm.model.scf_210.5 EVM.evm.TU.scf_210.5   scf_210:73643-77191(+)